MHVSESPYSSARGIVVFVAALSMAFAIDASAGQDDLFSRQRDDEAATNQSSGFTISFADGRRSFHPGEAIKLTFMFHRYDISPFNYEHCSGLGIADAVLDHSDGTADPQEDLWNNGVLGMQCGVLSGVMGGLANGYPPQPLIQFSVYLNQGVRFDRPGTYRFYVRSRHIRSPRDNRLPPLISNILTLDIVERDDAWELSTLERARRVLDTSTDQAANEEAARMISFLGTGGAIEDMASRFERVALWRDGMSRKINLNSYWLRGLYGARERGLVIARMEQELDTPDRDLSPRFVSQLAVLDLASRSRIRPLERPAYDARFHVYARRRLHVLKSADRLGEYLEQTFAYGAKSFSTPLSTFSLTPAFRDFPGDVEAALATLDRATQRTMLERERNWTMLHDRAFIPMLRRWISDADEGGPQDLALRLLFEVSPGEARQVSLDAFANSDAMVGILGTGLLPDRELPEFDDRFAVALETASTPAKYRLAIERIERFGSARIVNRVRRAYQRFPDARTCALAPPALAYFLRVAPAYARTQLPKIVTVIGNGEDCEQGLLPAVAERRMGPALEQIAITHLNHSDGWVVVDAARALLRHGTARAEEALWKAFEQWHNRWKGRVAELEADQRDSDYRTWEEVVEYELTHALTNGTAWRMNDAARSRPLALCLTNSCKGQVESDFADPGTSARLLVAPPRLPGGEPTFFVRDAGYAFLTSRAAMRSRMLLYAPGTSFVLSGSGWFPDDFWLPGEEDARHIAETRKYLESLGMKLIVRGQ